MNDNISMQRLKYGGFIQLLPNEIYFQISNASNDISFDDDISISIVDSCGKTLKSLMNGFEFKYKEFLNSFTLKKNIVFEFYINQDFNRELLLLKLKNNITSETWFSTPFQCTEILKEETSFFMYKNEEFLKGVDYQNQNYFQSIRLMCFKNDISEESESEEYTQLSGNKIYARNTVTLVNSYKFHLADWFTFKRLSFLLSHSIIYINNYRGFSAPSKISKGERIDQSNLITLDFDVNPTDEYKEYESQISVDLIYADNVTYPFTYSHEPIDTTNEGQWFLTNLLFNNYHNSFGITYDCDLKIKLFGIPVKGFLANNLTRQIYKVGDIISYCDKDNLVYYPNGFNNDLGVTGNYIELFTYKIIDQEDRIGRLISHTISMTDSAVEPIDISVAISWLDLTSTPKTGNLANITVKVASLVFDPLYPIISQEWEIWDGTSWIFYKTKTTDTEVLSLSYLDNKIRLKVVSQFSVVAYSNVLTYEKINTSTIYITDEVISSPGVKTFKLHIEDYDFVGFENMQGEKNANTRNGIVNSTLGGVLSIPSLNDMGEYARKSTAVNLPIGVYDYTISVNGNPRSTVLDLFVGGLVGYGYTTSINDNLAEVNVKLFIEAE